MQNYNKKTSPARKYSLSENYRKMNGKYVDDSGIRRKKNGINRNVLTAYALRKSSSVNSHFLFLEFVIKGTQVFKIRAKSVLLCSILK